MLLDNGVAIRLAQIRGMNDEPVASDRWQRLLEVLLIVAVFSLRRATRRRM